MVSEVDSWEPLLKAAGRTVLAGGALSFNEALRLAGLPGEHTSGLVRLAARVRQSFAGDKADLCSIVNARSGICPEDCRFCVQSGRYQTNSPVYPMRTAGEIVEAARRAEAAGAHRFCIVTSGGALDDRDFAAVLAALGQIGEESNLKRCASIGWLDRERAEKLRTAGLDRYHHNIETARGFFGSVCTTHSYDDRLQTITHLKAAGIETCIGGILNLGESPAQRIEFAFELRDLEPDSIPVNFLIPKEGTPFGNRNPIAAEEAARYLAIFRLIMPGADIRLAGGRLETFGDQPALPFDAGVNSLLIGDLLTTSGPDTRSDIDLLECLGFELRGGDEADL